MKINSGEAEKITVLINYQPYTINAELTLVSNNKGSSQAKVWITHVYTSTLSS